jgi:hypothetical protein
MPKQNRVNPYGEIIATAARGDMMGNRGILHNDQQQIVRSYKSKAWIICLLEFKGRRRSVMSPGKYTELFFLDEATALAAGHRPCYECQRERAKAFRDAWITANPDAVEGSSLRMGQIDEVLHTERLTTTRRTKDQQKRTYSASMNELPNGTFIEWQEQPCLVWDAFLYPWTVDGYQTPIPRPIQEHTVVLTPRSTVKVLASGYTPLVHQSAEIGTEKFIGYFL